MTTMLADNGVHRTAQKNLRGRCDAVSSSIVHRLMAEPDLSVERGGNMDVAPEFVRNLCRDELIVAFGGGPAGHHAVREILRVQLAACIVWHGDGRHHPYNRVQLSSPAEWPVNNQNAPKTEVAKEGFKAAANPARPICKEETPGGTKYFTAADPERAVADSPRQDFKTGGVVLRPPTRVRSRPAQDRV